MRLFRLLITAVLAYDIAIGQTSDDDEDAETMVEESDTSDEGDLDGGPVTEEVMEPNITINEPGHSGTEEKTEDHQKNDPNWDVNRAIRDLAYFLRAHKFQDWDRRYFQRMDRATSLLHQDFPKPRLRSLHWEVHQNCDSGFNDCLRYAEKIVGMTSLRRNDDTLTIMRENKWDLKKNSQQIIATQKDCQMAQRRDNLTVVPFQGPIERFQWRTTMSYYMCWYTMLEKPELEFFGEPCSNHANCLDSYGTNNRDPRANDDKPYACALYSFCPDHCCPMKHIWYMRDCFQSPDNPCYAENRPADRKCALNRDENQDFESLTRNRINVTCNCPKSGYEWSSRFGICVDVNECTRDMHECNVGAGQICINQPGSYACVCSLGLVWSTANDGCVPSSIIEKALQPSLEEENEAETKVESIFKSIVKTLTRSSANGTIEEKTSISTRLQFIFICIVIKLFDS